MKLENGTEAYCSKLYKANISLARLEKHARLFSPEINSFIITEVRKKENKLKLPSPSQLQRKST